MQELKHIRSIPGEPRPSDIFQPHLLSVDLFSDMDEFFRQAREYTSGEKDDEATRGWKKFDGQRAVAIVTPGRLTMFTPCPEPGSIPEDEVVRMGEILPPGPSLKISTISYTFVEALTTGIEKAIPFLGYLIAWAYRGHSVLVFEGHPSAFESGVRDCDMLLVDSGMLPFLPINWLDVATRVMKPDGRIFVHHRQTYTLSQIVKPDAEQLRTRSHAHYVELLLRFLVSTSGTGIVLTSGTVVPDLAELINDPANRWQLESFAFDREKLNTDTIIDILLQRAGWRWYTPFKSKGLLLLPTVKSSPQTRDWHFTLTLRKDSAGRRQLGIER